MGGVRGSSLLFARASSNFRSSKSSTAFPAYTTPPTMTSATNAWPSRLAMAVFQHPKRVLDVQDPLHIVVVDKQHAAATSRRIAVETRPL